MKKSNALFSCWIILSFVLTIIISEFNGDKWENIVRESYYGSFLTNDSIPCEYRIIVDSNGIPCVNYYTLNGITGGKQYNPTIIGYYAIQYYKQLEQAKDTITERYFFNCIERLTSDLIITKKYALFKFNRKTPFYPNIIAPHTSGLSSGLALEALVGAYKISHSEKYLDVAKNVLNGYYVPIELGGFAHQNEDGWWFEEYADTLGNGPHVLNGHIYAMFGAYEYYQTTKDDSALYIFHMGLKALKNNIHLYDTGENNWSYYDIYKKRADNKYQRIIVDQMKRLYMITHDTSFFRQYHINWGKLLEKPYATRILKERNKSGIILFLGIWLSMISVGIVMPLSQTLLLWGKKK